MLKCVWENWFDVGIVIELRVLAGGGKFASMREFKWENFCDMLT